MTTGSGYGLSAVPNAQDQAAPELAWRPPRPRSYSPGIALIGAGGITEFHLAAYRRMGLPVRVIANRSLERAAARRDQFFSEAAITDSWETAFRHPDVEVVDIALPTEVRAPVVEAAIAAGKHVLSQKPFAEDLATARRLADLADRQGVRLAVNQNGRWAPHFAYLRKAVQGGLVGDVATIDVQLAFDHSWTVGTPFEEVPHLVLFDFGIHWFDMAATLLCGRPVETVSASATRARHQTARPPFLASALLRGRDFEVRMSFNAATTYGQVDRTTVAGSLGTIVSEGPSLSVQTVRLTTAGGTSSPVLEGSWFENGFEGAMGELLCALEVGREPENSARNNLTTLALAFAARDSADRGLPVALSDG